MTKPTGHGPEIVAGLRDSRAAHQAGRRERSLRLVADLRRRYGDTQVDAVLGAVRLGFVSLDAQEGDDD